MRITAILLFFFNCTISIYAQTAPWFRDDFDSNDKNWFVGNLDSINYSVNNGQYSIINKKKSNKIGWIDIDQNIYIDPKKDFSLEAKLKISANTNSNSAGIYIGNTYNDMHFFSINPYDRTFLIGSMRKKANYESSTAIYTYTDDIWGWQSTTTFLPETDYQTISFQKKSGIFYFYINGQEVFKLEKSMFCNVIEQKIGFITSSKTEAHIDYIIFDQNNREHTLSPDAAPLKVTRLPTTINTYADEIHPTLSPDKKTLYFTRIGHKDNYPLDYGGPNEQNGDIYFSEYKDSTWTEAQRLEYGISNNGNNSIASMSPDGNSMLLFGGYSSTRSYSSMADGLAISYRLANGWSYPQNITVRNFQLKGGKVNYFLADNGYVLILSFHREDSKGLADLYVSFKQKNNTWSEPRHMGNQINTTGGDFAPFLCADNKTLYFATADLPGYGGVDTYMSKRLDDTWTNWSVPFNLGPSINNEGFNAYYKITTDASVVYYSSSKNAIGLSDIFIAEFPKELAPDPVAMIKGHVLDAKTKLPLAATIHYENLGDSSTIGICRSAPSDGSYAIILPYENTYGFYAQASGYISINENIDLEKIGAYQEISKDIYLVPIAIGETIDLNNVFFVRSKAELLPTSYSELNRLVKILKEYPLIEIEIRGYTDGYGDTQLNIELSEERAKTVAAYLIKYGIHKSRIKTKGYGKSNSVSPNDTEANREKNRRVEFVITKK